MKTVTSTQNRTPDSLTEQAGWYKDRASKLAVFSFELGRDLTLSISSIDFELERQDREWATKHTDMKHTDIALLRRCANEKAEECRQNSEQAARWAEHVGDRTFFPL